MKPSQYHSTGGPRGVCCELAAFASVRLPFEAVADLRKTPEALTGLALPASTFKHLDEQTVAGVTAVCRALGEFGLEPAACHDWGVLAAPHFLGKSITVTALERFRAEGAWGVSPHVIPHHSLHSLSGSVSQVLKMHGPNVGVGGARGGTGEALLAAAAWLGRRRVPGVWVVLTALDPLATMNEAGQPPAGTAVAALALALMPARVDSAGVRLRLLPGDEARRRDGQMLDQFSLHAALEQCRQARAAGGLVVSAAAPRVELEWGRPGRPTPAFRPGLLLKAAEAHPAAAIRLSTGAETDH